MQSSRQVPKDERAGSELTRKGVTVVALPAKTGLSGRPDSFCFDGSPAPGSEAGGKGPRTLTHLQSFPVYDLSPSNSDLSKASLPFRNLPTPSIFPTKLCSPGRSPGQSFLGQSLWSSQSQATHFQLAPSFLLWASGTL